MDLTDDETAKPKRQALERPAFYAWGVEELETYISDLRAEIARAEVAIAGKTGHRAAAEAVFGKLGGG